MMIPLRSLTQGVQNGSFAKLYGHEAGVTGLSWYDSSHLLSTGGSQDRTIRVWCINDGKEFFIVDTESQVTSIQRISSKIFVTTNGFLADANDNIKIWKLEPHSIQKIQDVASPHLSKVLYSSLNGHISHCFSYRLQL